MTRVVVVGAGITGLAAAHELAGAGVDVVVLGGGQVGGKIQTSPFAGHDVDRSADAFLARVPEGIELCRELGIDGDLVSPAARRAYVYTHDALRPLPEQQVLGVPTDLDEVAASGIVSPAGVAAARADLERPGPPPDGDEAIGAFIRRRLGDEVLERLVDPLVGGINAGDTDHLSLAAVTPQLDSAARGDEPSLIRACAAQRAAADPSRPVFFAPKGGMSVLVESLLRSLERAASSCAPTRSPSRWIALAACDSMAETSSPPTVSSSPCLPRRQPWSSAMSAPRLPRGSTRSAPRRSRSSRFAFDRDDIDHPLGGSGYLVPRVEGTMLTACSWASSKWAQLAGDGSTVILRASTGRAGDERWMDVDDGELVERLIGELAHTMQVRGVPLERRVDRWPHAFPQYQPGHLALIDAIERALASDAPRVAVTGAAFRGVGIPACIRQGRAAARELVARV